MNLSDLTEDDLAKAPPKQKGVLTLADISEDDLAPKAAEEKTALGTALPPAGIAGGVGLGLEGARRGVEATAAPLKNAAADAEFRAIGGRETDAGQDILKNDILNRSNNARGVGRASLDLGGSGLRSDLAHADVAKAAQPKDWFFRTKGAPESRQAAVVAKILEQKALKAAASGEGLSLSGLPSQLLNKFGPGVAAKGLDVAGNVAERAGSKFAKRLPIVGAALAGVLGYQNARADDEGVADSIASGAGEALKSADPTGLLDATPTGPKKGTPEAALESGDQVSFMLSRAPKRLLGAIRSAAARGPDALATTHRLLLKNDPEYRAAIEGADQ